MIQPIKLSSDVSFKGKEDINNGAKSKLNTAKEFVGAARDCTVDALKQINNVTGTTNGLAKGVVEGAAITTVVGVMGKNIKNAKGQIAGTLSGIGKDCLDGAIAAVKFVPSIITKAPLDNAKTIAGLPVKFYKSLKGNRLTALIATMAGVGVLAFRTVQGKMHANVNNANIDHNLNQGHLK